MPKEKIKSALNVMDGVEHPAQINADLVKKLHSRRKKSLSTEEFLEGIRSGNRTVLSQAITLVESSLPGDQELAQEVIAACLKQSAIYDVRFTKKEDSRLKSKIENRKSKIRIGITGVPGVGKSTFIEALGKFITARGHRLAVLAVDPSSSRSKGSILGDKTRMEELAVDPNAFIRPSPAAGSLGGVARKTRETIILCEAAGFDVIFVETVGVGQSETTVHSMVDFFLLLMLAGAGDELQGIKRGIIEMADAIYINKADGDNLKKAEMARREYANALHLFPPAASGWVPVVDVCSALSGLGIETVWNTIEAHHNQMVQDGFFTSRRMEQNLQVFSETIEARLKQQFFLQQKIASQIKQIEQEIIAGRLNPYTAASQLLARYNQKLP
jgi:LAO/AO transport system kinase